VQATVPAGWRNLPSAPQRVSFRLGESTMDVEYRLTRDSPCSNMPGEPTLVSATEDDVVLDVAGVRHRFAVAGYHTDDGRLVAVDSPLGPVSLATVPRFPDPDDSLADGATVAPMPGTVVRVAVQQGDRVDAGAELLVLEAMKMEHRITAANSGVVTELPVRSGQQVDAGTVLAVVADVEPDRERSA
jgi:propionyl-CoA carboxylase alpha chain